MADKPQTPEAQKPVAATAEKPKESAAKREEKEQVTQTTKEQLQEQRKDFKELRELTENVIKGTMKGVKLETIKDNLQKLTNALNDPQLPPDIRSKVGEANTLLQSMLTVAQELSPTQEKITQWTQRVEKQIAVLRDIGAGFLKMVAKMLGNKGIVAEFFLNLSRTERARLMYLKRKTNGLVDKDKEGALKTLNQSLDNTARLIRQQRKDRGDPEWNLYDFVNLVDELYGKFGEEPSTKDGWEQNAKQILVTETAQTADIVKKRAEAAKQAPAATPATPPPAGTAPAAAPAAK